MLNNPDDEPNLRYLVELAVTNPEAVLAAGAVVDEQERAEQSLRQHPDLAAVDAELDRIHREQQP